MGFAAAGCLTTTTAQRFANGKERGYCLHSFVIVLLLLPFHPIRNWREVWSCFVSETGVHSQIGLWIGLYALSPELVHEICLFISSMSFDIRPYRQTHKLQSRDKQTYFSAHFPFFFFFLVNSTTYSVGRDYRHLVSALRKHSYIIQRILTSL